MDVIISLLDHGMLILSNLVPNFIYVVTDLRNYLTRDIFNTAQKILLLVKLMIYIYIAIRMSYFFFFKKKLTYRESVPINLLVSILSISIILFILFDVKYFFVKDRKKILSIIGEESEEIEESEETE